MSVSDFAPLCTGGKSCAHFMACIQNCPAGAIEYGKLTQGKERYCFEKCRYVLSDGKPFPAPQEAKP